jgi:hypothetical protein
VFTAPTYYCNPEDCEVSYSWEIIAPDGNIVNATGSNFNFNFTQYGYYKFKITPICGTKRCKPCEFRVYIPSIQGEPNSDTHKDKNNPLYKSDTKEGENPLYNRKN